MYIGLVMSGQSQTAVFYHPYYSGKIPIPLGFNELYLEPPQNPKAVNEKVHNVISPMYKKTIHFIYYIGGVPPTTSGTPPIRRRAPLTHVPKTRPHPGED